MFTWCRVDLTRNLTVGDFGDHDQKVIAVQILIDCAVVDRVAGRQIERPGGDGAYHTLSDFWIRANQKIGSTNDCAHKPRLQIHSSTDRQFAHRLFQRGSLCLIALVDESMGKARLGDVISNGKCCHAVDPEDAPAAEMSRCAGCLSSEKGSWRTSGRRLAVVPGTLRYRSARQS